MNRLPIALLSLALLASLAIHLPAPSQAQDAPAEKARPLTDAQIRKLLIQESIEGYPGNCPCPYNLASNGSRCGKRSAWSKPGGYSPLCYDRDVTDDMVKTWRDGQATP